MAVQFNGASLVPDVSPLTNSLGKLFETRRLEQKQEADKKLQREIREKAAKALNISDIDDPMKRRIAVARMAQDAYQNGGDVELWTDVLNEQDPVLMKLKLTNIATKGIENLDKYLGEGLKNKGSASGGLASAKTEILQESGGTIQVVPRGPGLPAEIFVTDGSGQLITDPAERLKVIQKNRELKQKRLQKEADRTIETANETERAKLRQKRYSDIQSELSTKYRDFNRTLPRLNQALSLAEEASQGLTGSMKLKLSKLIPGVDVTDEAALNQTLVQLTLDQLASFKGPTTDFEYNIAQSSVGEVGDNKSANISRIKSLQRANWFMRREYEQFKEFKNFGGDPDDFSFNFNEQVKTKKGVYSLQDLQDTAVENNLNIEEVIKRLNE